MSSLVHDELLALLSYHQLQNECRKLDLETTGKTEVLRQRLRDHLVNGQAKSDPNPSIQKRQKMSHIAEDLVCPISLELPFDPVIAADGRVYERSEIEMHINSQKDKRGHLKSPYTNERMGTTLLPSPQIKSLIQNSVENGFITGELANKWKEKVEEQKSKEELLKEAERGNERAMFRVGDHYDEGEHGFPKDKKLAYYWYEKAHYAGNVKGTALIGACLGIGSGVPKCHKTGIMYLAMAAEKGSNYAAYCLGRALAEENYGLAINPVEAIYYLQKVVDPNCPIHHLEDADIEVAQELLEKLQKTTKASK